MAYLIPPELFELLEYFVLFILVMYTTGCAYLAVSVKSVYHAVLWLIFCLLGVAMIFLLYAGSALLLVIQIIVYAGGITILMLFAISLSGKEAMFESLGSGKLMDWRLSFAGAFLLFMVGAYILSQVSSLFWTLQDLTSRGIDPEFPDKAIDEVLIGQLAEQMFTLHGGTILTLGLLVLGAMLGSVYLVKKEVEDV
ncbi:MAG: NADH-quinone oxidoreductase subunit J family protein [Candidatus Hodarchaeales archaeon]|jgi:NADH:ubiquinone oxidoreductase subunit 6 (subunit J)